MFFVTHLVIVIRTIRLLTVPDHGSVISVNYQAACNVSRENHLKDSLTNQYYQTSHVN